MHRGVVIVICYVNHLLVTNFVEFEEERKVNKNILYI